MALKLPSPTFGISKDFLGLIRTFNSVPEEDHIQRLFYLQKINHILTTLTPNSALFAWLSDTEANGWQAHLNAYSINADASIFVKGMQFSEAIARHTENKPLLSSPDQDVYALLQERDQLLKNPSYDGCKDRYIAVSCQLHVLIDTDQRIKAIVKRHSEILFMAKTKLDAIQKRKAAPTDSPIPSYKTEELGSHVNNYNFKFKMEGWDEPFVFRVEDRDKLGLEQNLHSFPVAKYFVEDYAVFMMAFKGEELPIEYKPVVLSQFASGGNLAQVARSLRGTRDKDLGPIASHYFTQLGDFCDKLINAGVFHPDIKLTNFLVHANLIRVADRKTFIAEEHPKASMIRTTPQYAPNEFNRCLNEDWTGYSSHAASITEMNMPQFMAFQLGMALKEFLILTQTDSLPELDQFREHDFNPAHYFETIPHPIANFSLLIQELTRPDPNKRLSIQQFNKLLKFRNLKPDQFYKKIEEELPYTTLGLQEDIDAINTLLNGSFPETEFITQANILFNKISRSQEPRLIRMAEKLASKCYYEYAEPLLKRSIETALLNNDWKAAPWYRQLIHVLSFGYFRVHRVTSLSEILDEITLDLNSEPFLSYLPHLDFLPPSTMNDLGETAAKYLKNFIKQHVEMIIPDDAMTELEPSSESPVAPIAGKSQKTSSLNVTPASDAVLVSNMKKDAPLKSDANQTEQSLDEASSESPEYRTTVITDKKQKPVSVAQGPSFFSDNKADGEPRSETPVKRTTPVNRVDSIRTSLFRGDGNHRIGSQNHRPPIGEFVWDPLPANRGDSPKLAP